MKHILLIAFLSPILVMGQVITPVDLTPPSDTPREGFQKLNTNDANIKARLDSIVAAGLGGGTTTVPFDSITDLPPTLSEHGITDAWKTSGTTTLTDDVLISPNEKGLNIGGVDNELFGSWYINELHLYSYLYGGNTVFGGASTIFQHGNNYNNELRVGLSQAGDKNGTFIYTGTSSSELRFSVDQDGEILMNLPGTDAPGDIPYRGVDGFLDKLPLGSEGQVLSSVSGLPAWTTVIADAITNGVTTSAPNQDQVFDALALKQTITPTSSTGTAVAFDTNRSYCSTASPCTGNITFTSTGAVVGQMATMIHNDSSEPTFGTEFIKLSGTYATGQDNYIMFFLRESGKVWVTISQAQ